MHGCIHRFLATAYSLIIEWNRRARHIVAREVIVCRVMSGPIESSDDDVSRRVAEAAAAALAIRTRVHTSGSDHAVDDEDGSDSEVSMRCEFVDSMAAESRSVQSDDGATSADSDPCETD